jgi:hypothetical protein
MPGSNPHGDRAPDPFLQRLDRAAAAVNPILAIVTIGLVILNLAFVFSLVLPLRLPHGQTAGGTATTCLPDANQGSAAATADAAVTRDRAGAN